MTSFCGSLAKIATRIPQKRLFSSSYKSSLSLEHLYPSSSLKLTTPSGPPNQGQEKFSGFIPFDELDINYSRSTGPGGQNVNKVNTKVEVRFHVNSAKWITDDIKIKFLEKFKNKITKDGFVIFRSDITRYQQLNLADCLEKIRASVRSCDVIEEQPSEETAERIRRRHEKAARERLAIKRIRSQVKSERQAPEVD